MIQRQGVGGTLGVPYTSIIMGLVIPVKGYYQLVSVTTVLLCEAFSTLGRPCASLG